MTSIEHTSDLRYKYYLWWLKALNGIKGNAHNTAYFQQKNIEFNCNGKVDTRFGGVTAGAIIYNGKTYYARAYSNFSTIDCKV